MSGKSIPATSLPVKNRLPLKLAALFIVAFLAVFISGLGYDLFATAAENRQTEADSLAQPALKPIEPKIESDLAKVLAFDSTPTPSEIKDPFSDKAGISGNANTSGGNTVSTSATPTSQQALKPQNKLLAGQLPTSNPGLSGTTGFPFPNGMNPMIPATSLNTPTVQRFRAREQQLRLGQAAPPESTVFEIDDLLPVGVVSGGSGQPEILLYSESLMKTVSFSVGAQFFDGWLAAWKPEGIEFGYANQMGAVRLKPWARSVKPPESKNSAANNAN